MKCPRDSASLAIHSIRNVELHACRECGGVFVGLDQKEVPGLSFRALRPGERSRIPVEEDAKLVSPVTGGRMLVFRYRGVEIDYCPDSNAVWLDRGEWEKITDQNSDRSRKGNWSISDLKPDRNPILEGIDAAFTSFDFVDFIGDAVSSIFDGW